MGRNRRRKMTIMKLQAGLFLTVATASLGVMMAQPPEGFGGGRGGRGGRGGPGGFMRMNPIFQALDTDEDGELSKSEIKNAAKALRKLDKNKDGELTMDEVRPNFPQGGPGGPGGGEGRRRGEGGPEGRDPGGPPQQGNDPEEMVKNLMAFDKNGDGKLSKDELPERMQGMLERGDTNKDGFLTPDEIRIMAAAQQGPGGGMGRGGPGGGGRRPDPLFAALDLNHDGILQKEEIDAAPESLKALDKNGDGKITMDELRPAGGPNGGPDRPNRDRQQ